MLLHGINDIIIFPHLSYSGVYQDEAPFYLDVYLQLFNRPFVFLKLTIAYNDSTYLFSPFIQNSVNRQEIIKITIMDYDRIYPYV